MISRKSNPLNSNLPIRTNDEALRIERQTEHAAISAHIAFFRKLFEILPTAKYENIRVDETERPIKCTDPLHTRSGLTPQQIASVNQRFIAEVGLREAIQIDAAAQAWLSEFYGTTGAVNASTPYKKGLWNSIKAAFKYAWDRLTGGTATLEGPPLLAVETSTQAAFIEEMYRNGFQLVRDKIMADLVPNIKAHMIAELEAGSTWAQIARSLKSRFSVGERYQWRRLVRTEMAAAIDQSTRAQYRAAGIEFVAWSMAPGGCPICQPYADQRFYRIDNAPAIPVHPNCRCTVVEVYRLPTGVEVG